MFGLGSKLKRIGSKALKVEMRLELRTFTTNDTFRNDIAHVYFEFVRGSNSVVSSRKEWPETIEKIVEFNEVLKLTMTLYQNKEQTFLEKKGKLVMKGVSRVTHSTEVLGSVELKLHVLAADFGTQRVQFEIVDPKKHPIGKISVSTTATFLGEGKDDDDSSVASSIQSGMDGVPAVGMGGSLGLHHMYSGRSADRYNNAELISKFNNYDSKPAAGLPVADSSSNPFKDALEDEGNVSSPEGRPPASDPSPPVEKAVLVAKKTGIAGGAMNFVLGITKDKDKKAAKTSAAEDDSALLSLRAKKSNNARSGTEKSQSSSAGTEAAGGSSGRSGGGSNHPPPVPPATTATRGGGSGGNGNGGDDRDRELADLRRQLAATNTRQNNLEDEFQAKITEFIERIIAMEDTMEVETFRHEEVVIKLLKAAGVYEKSGYDPHNNETTEKLHDEKYLVDLFRRHLDDERQKISAMKQVLLQFSDQLGREENNQLMKVGVILTPNMSE